jgi:hypothetical protein
MSLNDYHPDWRGMTDPRDARIADLEQQLANAQSEAKFAREHLERARVNERRYLWLRTAGAWESEIGMDELSKHPEKFDAAIDQALASLPGSEAV